MEDSRLQSQNPNRFSVRSIYSRSLEYLNCYFIRKWKLDGLEIKSARPLKILYFGSQRVCKDLSQRLFSVARETPLGRTPLFQIQNDIEKNKSLFDLAMIEINPERERHSHLKTDYKLPLFMKMELHLTDQAGSLEKRSALSEVRRRIARGGFESEISTSLKDFDDFYFKMYLPHVRSRFHEAALEHNYEQLKRNFSDFKLLLVRQGKEKVGGGLIQLEDAEEGRVLYLGVRDGSEKFLKQGVTDAVYYFSFLLMRDLGLKTAHLGGVRPFLRDGVLKYKLGWGGKFGRSHFEPAGFLGLITLHSGPGEKIFFENHPFIAYKAPGDYHAVHRVAVAEKEKWGKFYRDKGLQGAELFEIFKETS